MRRAHCRPGRPPPATSSRPCGRGTCQIVAETKAVKVARRRLAIRKLGKEGGWARKEVGKKDGERDPGKPPQSSWSSHKIAETDGRTCHFSPPLAPPTGPRGPAATQTDVRLLTVVLCICWPQPSSSLPPKLSPSLLTLVRLLAAAPPHTPHKI